MWSHTLKHLRWESVLEQFAENLTSPTAGAVLQLITVVTSWNEEFKKDTAVQIRTAQRFQQNIYIYTGFIFFLPLDRCLCVCFSFWCKKLNLNWKYFNGTAFGGGNKYCLLTVCEECLVLKIHLRCIDLSVPHCFPKAKATHRVLYKSVQYYSPSFNSPFAFSARNTCCLLEGGFFFFVFLMSSGAQVCLLQHRLWYQCSKQIICMASSSLTSAANYIQGENHSIGKETWPQKCALQET